MTLDEAEKIAVICCTADGGCSVCVSNLEELLNTMFPEFVWTLNVSEALWDDKGRFGPPYASGVGMVRAREGK